MRRWMLYCVVVLALIVQMVVVMPSGSHYCHREICGVYFWGSHEHDGVWHMALINNALTTWPARFPTFSGELLTGYNSLLDWFIKLVHTVTRIPVLSLYFKVLPLLWFGAMLLVYKKFAASYSKNIWYLPSLFFFIFFGNSFSYFFRYYHEGIIWGASGLLSMQSPQMLNNIQFAMTLPIVGVMLSLFMREKLSVTLALSLAGLNFVMMGLKFYGGIIAVLMSLVYAITLILSKKTRFGLIVGGLSLLGFLGATWIFYDPLRSLDGPAILTYKPFATVHPIIEEAGLFFAPGIANLRNNLAASGVSPRLILIEIATLALFITANWGTRLVGLFRVKTRSFDWIILSGIVGGLLLNVLFVQRGEWWNTVQFLYYALFLANIYAAHTLSDWISRGWMYKALAVLIILLTIPNGIDTYRVFASFPPHSYVSDREISALEKLKELPKGVVMALPIGSIPGNDEQLPRPLYNMYDTAYVAAFSTQQTYLNDLVQMRLTGIDYSNRYEDVRRANCKVLSEIKYIYVGGGEHQLFEWKKCRDYSLERIYSNEEASIYLVITDTPNQ